MLGGCEIHLTDTAGLRETDDPVEMIGVQRSGRAMEQADVVLAVLDASELLTGEDSAMLAKLAPEDTIILLNKGDLPAQITAEEAQKALPGAMVLLVSAAQPDTLAPLKRELAARAAVSDRVQLTQPRHLEAARRAEQHIRQAIATLAMGMPVDLCTVDLQAAQAALGEITGDQVEEKLLDAVFGRFCVGK